MATATAYCSSSTPFHQHSLTSPRSQYGAVSRRNTLSSSSTSFSSNLPLSSADQLTIVKLPKSDENNNHEHSIDNSSISDGEDMLHIASDRDDVDISDEDVDHANTNIEEYLLYVGLRLKTKKPSPPIAAFSPLIKEYAHPTCFLAVPKYTERIRQAFRLLKPPIKHLSSTRDYEVFCTTDDNAKAQSLLPRTNAAASRAKSTLTKHSRYPKLIRRTDLISMATSAFRRSTSRTPKSAHVRSVLECNVILDRLEQATIDKIIQDAIDADDQIASKTSSSASFPTSSKSHFPTTISKYETPEKQTTVMPEQVVVKRRSSTVNDEAPKRFKSIENTSAMDDPYDKTDDLSSSAYKRIYLKCFACSKRQFVGAQATHSNVLHTHWFEHAGDLSLNIYDSEIDSILTRVVEFFNLPRQHLLEGKIKTVFIYNSKEIRSMSSTNLPTDDSYIVID